MADEKDREAVIRRGCRELAPIYVNVELDERSQIEYVFGLLGGELSDKPLVFWAKELGRDCVKYVKYWYEGAPEWSEEDLPAGARGGILRTLLHDLILPSILEEGGIIWTRIVSYTGSGERECPYYGAVVGEEAWRDEVDSVEIENMCSLCGRDRGEDHGYIYLGEGWTESIYVGKTDYSWVTNELFDEKLTELVDDMTSDELLAVPGVYEVIKEHLNNEVLEALANEREEENVSLPDAREGETDEGTT